MKGNMAVECYVAMHFQATMQSEVASYIAGLAELTYNWQQHITLKQISSSFCTTRIVNSLSVKDIWVSTSLHFRNNCKILAVFGPQARRKYIICFRLVYLTFLNTVLIYIDLFMTLVIKGTRHSRTLFNGFFGSGSSSQDTEEDYNITRRSSSLVAGLKCVKCWLSNLT